MKVNHNTETETANMTVMNEKNMNSVLEYAAKIEGLNEYIWFKHGKCWSNRTKSFIGYDNGHGYIQVTLTDDNGKVQHEMLHRMIWKAFGGRELEHGETLNHKNENPYDNSFDNLEAMTLKDNVNYGTANERRSLTRRMNSCFQKIDFTKRLLKEIEAVLHDREFWFGKSDFCLLEDEKLNDILQFNEVRLNELEDRLNELEKEKKKLDKKVQQFRKQFS